MLTAATGPSLGASWSVDLDCSAIPPGLSILRVTSVPAPQILSLGRFGELLVPFTPGTGVTLRQPHAGGSVTYQAQVPLDLSLLCLPFYVQGFCGSPGQGFLSNGFSQLSGL